MAISYVSSLSSSLPSMNDLCTELLNVKSYLHCLLHPLSHSVPDLPMYKAEMISVYNSYRSICNILETYKLKEKCVCILESSSPLRLQIKKKDGVLLNYFFIPTKNYFCYLGDSSILADMKCRITKMYQYLPNGNKKGEYSPEKKDSKFAYNSIQEMIESIKTFLPNTDYGKDAIVAADTDFVIEILNTDNKWSLFSDYIKNKLNN